MARRNPNISISIDGEADLSKARKAVQSDLDKMESDAKSAAKGIDRAFSNLSPELDTSEIRKAVDLAGQLDGMVANLTVDTDISEIQEAEKLAKALRGFQAKVDLSVEGRSELADVLGLAEKMDQIRQVKVQVQGRQDLEKADQIANGLERTRTIPVEVDTDELSSSVENAFDGIDVNNIAGDIGNRLTGALAGAGAIGSGLALLAEAWGDDLMAGFNRGFSANKTGLETQIITGFDAVELRPIGEAAGESYSAGFGEGLQGLTIAGATLQTSLAGIDDSLDLTKAIESAAVLEEHLGVGIPDSALLAARMIRQGLAEDTVEAMDIMTYATQNFGDTGIEALDVMKEFGTVFGRMGIDGAAGVDFIARSFAEGLLPTIDRGAELIEEFQIRITDLDSEDAIKQIGVDFEHVSNLLADGRGKEALEIVTTALLNVKSSSEQATIANIIFGAAMESAFDRPEVIRRLQDLAQSELNVAGASERAVVAARESQTEWEKTSRTLENLASVAGGVAFSAFNDLSGAIGQVIDGFGLWGDSSDNLSGKIEALGDIAGLVAAGPLGTLVADVGKGIGNWLTFGEEAETAGVKIDYAAGAMTGAREAAGQLSSEIDRSTTAAEETTLAIAGLDAALKELSGRFDADQIFIRIEQDAKAAMEATKDLTAADYDLIDGFDITTEAGQNAATALMNLSTNTDQLTAAFRDGNASAADLADGQRRVEDTLRQVAAQMRLNQAETDALIAKYGGVQDEIYTAALFESENALAAVLLYQRELGRIPSQKTTTVATNFVTTGTRVYQTGGGFAEGGPVTGGVPIIVGEEGPELYVPNHGDGEIIPADETRRLLDSNPRARAALGSGVGGGGTQRVEIVIGSDGTALGDFFVRTMRKEIRNRGGNLDVVFG